MAPLRRCLAVAMIAAVLATQTAAAATASPSSSPRPGVHGSVWLLTLCEQTLHGTTQTGEQE
jgi:hypothetical protein